MPKLRTLWIEHTTVTYAGLKQLLSRHKLRQVFVYATKLTDKEADQLAKQFPDTTIEFDY